MKYKRIFVIVMDSLGVGEMPDASRFHDQGSNTLKHIIEKAGPINAPTLEKLGIGDFVDIGFKKVNHPNSYTCILKETSNGKDTMTGHWEMMGINTKKPFKTFFDNGFPKELIDELEKQTGRKVIGNYAASGTEIIKVLGEEHIKDGSLIVYTSSDSVLQIAANEAIIPVEELYKICEIARKITLKDEWKVGRIIARPFIGDKADSFVRTKNRHDYALSPSSKTYLDYIQLSGLDVISVGKIFDIFNGQGLNESNRIKSNHNGMEITTEFAKNRDFKGLCFVNLVDFDSEYGHRRNIVGYKDSLEEFDKDLGLLIKELKDDDLLIITADHGNDPTATGTDHTREQVPAIFYSKSFKVGKYNGESNTFASLGSTIVKLLNVDINKQNELLFDDLSEKLI